LTLLGCLRNGTVHDPGYLYVKATLDGFSSMALASSLGIGVLASVLTVITVQGALSLCASGLAQSLNGLSIAVMTAVGGMVLLATALSLLDIKKMAVANLLPGVLLPPFVLELVEWLSPGTLLPMH
jgi:hypothetical protein